MPASGDSRDAASKAFRASSACPFASSKHPGFPERDGLELRRRGRLQAASRARAEQRFERFQAAGGPRREEVLPREPGFAQVQDRRAGERAPRLPELAELARLLGEQVDEELAAPRRHEFGPFRVRVGAEDDVVQVVDDARLVGQVADEGEDVHGGARVIGGARLVLQVDHRLGVPLLGDRQVVAPARHVVVDVDRIPGEGLEAQEALRNAVRDVPEDAAAQGEPEGEAVLGEHEPAWAGQRDVQVGLGIGDQQGEVEEEPAVPALREEPFQLREVAVARHVADLQRAVAADVERRRELDAPLGVAEDREGVRSGGGEPVVEAVADQEGRRGAGGNGEEQGRQQEGQPENAEPTASHARPPELKELHRQSSSFRGAPPPGHECPGYAGTEKPGEPGSRRKNLG